MPIRLLSHSYRFAEQVLNSRLTIKKEIEDILTDPTIDLAAMSRPGLNSVFRDLFVAKGWQDQPAVFDAADDPSAKMDFLKDRVGIEVEFGHASFIGIDLLKFQVASYSALDRIDVGVYIVTTRNFRKRMIEDYGQKWGGSLCYEKVTRYLPHFRSAIQVPVCVIGLDL